MNDTVSFPTSHHADAAQEVTSFVAGRTGGGAVLLIASCARGMAVPESDLDMVVLVAPEHRDLLDDA